MVTPNIWPPLFNNSIFIFHMVGCIHVATSNIIDVKHHFSTRLNMAMRKIFNGKLTFCCQKYITTLIDSVVVCNLVIRCPVYISRHKMRIKDPFIMNSQNRTIVADVLMKHGTRSSVEVLLTYIQTSNISRTSVGNYTVGAAPTTFSILT